VPSSRSFRRAAGAIIAALVAAPAHTGAAPAPTPGPATPPTAATTTTTNATAGSLQRFSDAIAQALLARAADEQFRGGVRFAVEAAHGVDETRVRRTLLPRLRRALVGTTLDGDGPLTARIAVSEESGTIWSVVVVDGPGLAGPSTVVTSAPADRELLAALGAVARTVRGRFVLERGGTAPATPGCPVLDVALSDVDGDPALELALLTRCGVDVVHVDDDGRVQRIGDPIPLPPRRWPRVVLGWLAPLGSPPHRLWLVTSAGHALVVDLRTGVVEDGPREFVPLRGAVTPEGPLAVRGRVGSPVLTLPLRTPAGVDLVVPGLPARVRDLALLDDIWVFVAEDGALGARTADGELAPLSPEHVGDRLLTVDLDGDGGLELVTTAATAPGEPDQLVVRRPAPGGSSSTVLLKSPLDGGSIVGLAAGHVDYDARVDVVIVEEAVDGGALTLWRLGHLP
jgi:hypothetical protein